MKFEIKSKHEIGDTVTYGSPGKIVDMRLVEGKDLSYFIQYRIEYEDNLGIWLDELYFDED